MKRYPVKASKDRKVFSHTADKTKAVNLPKTNYRGGFRF